MAFIIIEVKVIEVERVNWEHYLSKHMIDAAPQVKAGPRVRWQA